MKFSSPVYSQVSGSVAGLTYSHNRGGLYTRARATPTDPNSTAQQAARAAMTSAVQSWGDTLSAAQRTAWDTYALNVPVTDRLGATIYLSGQQHFLRTNVARLRGGLALATAAPTTYDTGQPNTGAFVQLDGLGACDAGGAIYGAASDDGDVLVQLGPPQGPAINFFKGPYQFVGTAAVASAATNSSVAGIATPFGLPIDAERIPVRIRMAYDDGRLSAPYEEIVVVTTAP